MYVLHTERLSLRKMTEDDSEKLQEIFTDSIAMQYYPSTKNMDETLRWIHWTHSNYVQYGVGLWIVERKEDRRFIGQCGVVPMDVNGSLKFEIGYLFVRQFWGNGYATEAARACRDWGFENLEITRLISLPSHFNQPSKRVAERIGMNLHEQIIWNGKPTDVYAITRDEWYRQKS